MEPIAPKRAQTLYLSHRETEVAPSTLQSHEYRLNHFVRWCHQQDIENLNELSGRDLHEYRTWRRKDGELSPAAEKTQMDTIRVFMRFLETIDGVPKDLSESVQSPRLSKSDKSRDEHLKEDEAKQVLQHLERFQYAQRYHVLYLLAWRTAMRTSALYSLDVSDYDRDEQYLKVRNRPDQGTRLKQGDDGERMVSLRRDTCAVLNDYLKHHREDIEEANGREPLITTTNGRMSKTSIRRVAYKVTRPCFYKNECPHDREISECRAAKHQYAYECPSSVSPHPLRRSAISHWLDKDWPTRAVSDRANVSPEVLKEHYDARDQKQKMEQRRGFLDDL